MHYIGHALHWPCITLGYTPNDFKCRMINMLHIGPYITLVTGGGGHTHMVEIHTTTQKCKFLNVTAHQIGPHIKRQSITLSHASYWVKHCIGCQCWWGSTHQCLSAKGSPCITLGHTSHWAYITWVMWYDLWNDVMWCAVVLCMMWYDKWYGPTHHIRPHRSITLDHLWYTYFTFQLLCPTSLYIRFFYIFWICIETTFIILYLSSLAKR